MVNEIIHMLNFLFSFSGNNVDRNKLNGTSSAVASCSTFVNNKNITFIDLIIMIIKSLITYLLNFMVSVGLVIGILKTKGFLESGEDLTLISSAPVY